MLSLSICPPDYSPAGAPLRYIFTGTSDGTAAEIVFTDTGRGETLGVRTVVDNGSGEVNASCFASRGLDPRPSVAVGCALSCEPGRTVRMGGSTGSSRFPDRVFTAAAVAVQPLTAQSGLHVRSLAPGERDEVSVLAPAGRIAARLICRCPEQTVLELPALTTTAAGAVTLTVDAADLAARLSSAGADPAALQSLDAVLEFDSGGSLSFPFRAAAPRESWVRLCWLSQRGAVEFHTFGYRPSDQIAIARLRAGSGGPLIGSRAGRRMRVATGYLPSDAIARLVEAACAARLWRVCEGRYVPVEADADRVELRSDGFCRLEFTIADSVTAVYDSFLTF